MVTRSTEQWHVWLGALTVGALALVLYASTAARDLTWAHDGADGGELIVAALRGGVPHPSGYPTYCLLGRLLAYWPIVPIARRFNLFSGLCGALSSALIYVASRRLVSARHHGSPRLATWAAAAAALLMATGTTLWSQSTITEVYALQACFSALCWVLALHLALRPPERTALWPWGALGLAFGAGLGSHLTLILLVPGLAVLLWPRLTRRSAPALGIGTLVGLCALAYLPLAARRSPVVNWGDASTWPGFWWLLSGRPYRGYVLSLPLRYLPSRLAAWALRWRLEFGLLGLTGAAFGLATWDEKGQRRLLIGSLLGAVLYSIFALGYDTADSYVYLLPVYQITALWLAAGLSELWQALNRWPAASRALRVALIVLALALPGVQVARHWTEMNLSADREARQWIEETFAALPARALLITGQDNHTFAMDYAQWVEGQRRDVLVLDGELLGQGWYQRQIQARYPELALPTLPGTVEGVLLSELGQRPAYLASRRPELEQDWIVEPRGPLWRVSAPDASAATTRQSASRWPGCPP